MLRILLIFIFLFSLTARAQFSAETKIKADEIQNNTAVDILLNPVSSVKVNSLVGGFALQSGSLKELKESAVTSTELGFVSGVTSSIQTQLDGKLDSLPLSVNGDILFYNGGLQSLPIGTANQVLTVTGGLPVWADTQGSSPTTTLGDIIYNDGGGSGSDTRLSIGSNDQILTVVGGVPAWADNAAVDEKECQTKTLAADFSSNGTVTDLTMNNVTIGDKFSANLLARFQVGAMDATASVAIINNAVTLASGQGGNGSANNVSFGASVVNNCFVSGASTVTVVTSSLAAGSLLRAGVTFQLCKLPDATVCNSTIFN